MTRSDDEDLDSAEFTADLGEWGKVQDFGEPDAVDEPDPVAPVGASNELLVRPPPSRMYRRDRRAWLQIEAGRIARVRDRQREEGLGFSDGFAHRPPRALGRSGRRAFRSADRVNRAQWWERRRARDADTRAIGVLILTLLLVGYIAFRLIWGGNDAPAQGSTLAGSLAASVPAAAVSPSTGNATASSGELSQTSPSSAPTSVPATSAAPATSQATAAGSAGAPTSLFGNGGNTSRSPAPVTASSLLPAGVATVIAAPANTTGVPAPSGPVPAADRKTASSTGLAWFQRTCGSSWQQPFGAALTANRSAMTPQGWAYADPARDAQGRQWWTGVVKARQIRRCSHLSVEKFAGPAPSGPATVVMVFQADRIVTPEQPGAAATVEKVNELRTMSRGDDGLWSVGPVKMAG